MVSPPPDSAGIDPRDIERIEVIKGAAASTLYGTEAAAGVIQIFTKRGRAGTARWTANMDQTFTRVGHVGPEADPTGLHLNDCTTAGPSAPMQTDPDPDCPASGSWLKMGHGQKFDVNVRGGSEDLTYFLSTGLEQRAREHERPERRSPELQPSRELPVQRPSRT